jgi:O-antigen ligase
VFPQLYNLKIPLLLSVAALTALVWHTCFSGKIIVYWRLELTMVSMFFVLVILGIGVASNVSLATNYFINIYWKIAIMTYAIAWLTRDASDFSLTSRSIAVSGLLVGGVALYNKLFSIGLVEGSRVTIGRDIGSVLGDPNDLALVLMFPASFALSLLVTKGFNTSTRILGLVSLLVLFSAVLATQSRGGLLGILAIFGVYSYRRVRSKIVFFSLGAIAAVLLFALAGISDRVSGGAAEDGIDASAMGRLYAWKAAFGMALANPLSGVGLNNFYANYFFYSPHWDGLNHAVHSTWFGVLAETGFLGLILFAAIIVMLLKTSINALNRIEQQPDRVDSAIHASALAVLTGLVGTVVSGTFLTQGFTWPIYILAALVVAVAQWVDSNLPKTVTIDPKIATRNSVHGSRKNTFD